MMKGKRIRNLLELHLARADRRSVIVPDTTAWNKPCPAAFMLQLSGEILHKLFGLGMYVYVPKDPKRRWTLETYRMARKLAEEKAILRRIEDIKTYSSPTGEP